MTVHVSVLKEEIEKIVLEPFHAWVNSGEAARVSFVDCTFGGGGHTSSILTRFENWPNCEVISFDRDNDAIERGRKTFEKEITEKKLTLIHAPFSEAHLHLKDKKVLGILADLGFSSDQMDTAERGFSFQREGPLDMRMNQAQGPSASDLLLTLTEEQIANLIFEYGEERLSRPIARAIVRERIEGRPIQSTKQLEECVWRSVPKSYRHGRIHPATRTFQALRIAVNSEMQELDSLLNSVLSCLYPSGRMGIISFHSLEDRKVKHAFKEQAQSDSSKFELLTKKPILPSEEEERRNPRARSAKLRFIERK